MVDMAAEGPPHLRDPVRGGVGPGEVLLAGEQAPEQERSRGTNAGVIGHDQMRAANSLEHPVVESHSSHLRPDETQNRAVPVHRHQRRKLSGGPALVN